MPDRQGNPLKSNLISGVSPDGTLYFGFREESIDGRQGLWFLEQLLKEVEGRPMAIWDNGRIHR